MSCAQIGERLADYSAGLLAGRRRAEVEAHLAQCAACREHLAELQAMDRLFAADRAEAPEALVRRVMNRVRATAPVPRWSWVTLLGRVGPAFAISAIAAVVVLALQQQLAGLGQWTSVGEEGLTRLLSGGGYIILTLAALPIAAASLWASMKLARVLSRT